MRLRRKRLCGAHERIRRRAGRAWVLSGPGAERECSNAIQYSDQPGSPFENTPNPDYVAGLANPEALRLWLNDEVNLVSTTDLFVADATLSGSLVENVADFAVGYQYRGMRADGDPNDPRRRDQESVPGGRRHGLRGWRSVRALPLHQRPPPLSGGPAGAAGLRRGRPARRPPVGYPARRELRVLQCRRPPCE